MPLGLSFLFCFRKWVATDTPEDFESLALEVHGSVKRRLLRSREALSAGGADEALI